MKKKTLITWGIVILCILAIGTILTIKVFNKKDNATADNKESAEYLKNENLIELIDTINKLNENFTKSSFTEDGKYEEDNRTCYAYTGNSYEAVKLIEQVYLYAYEDTGAFNLVTSTYDDFEFSTLYVCFPDNCTIDKITSYDIVKDTLTSERAEVKLNKSDKTYTLTKMDGIWKFDYPVLLCK